MTPLTAIQDSSDSVTETVRGKLLNCVADYRRRYPEDSERTGIFEDFFKQDLAWLDRTTDFGHVTASGWVLSPDLNSVALIFHRKLNRWLQPGGHADLDPLTLRAAAREVIEETGIGGLEVFDLNAGKFVFLDENSLSAPPFDLDAHQIPAIMTFPAHIHFDFRYLFRAQTTETLCVDAGVAEVRWFSGAEIQAAIGEPSMLRMWRRAQALVGAK